MQRRLKHAPTCLPWPSLAAGQCLVHFELCVVQALCGEALNVSQGYALHALHAGRLWRYQQSRTGVGTASLSPASLSGRSRGLCSEGLLCARAHDTCTSCAAHLGCCADRNSATSPSKACVHMLGPKTVLCTSRQVWPPTSIDPAILQFAAEEARSTRARLFQD